MKWIACLAFLPCAATAWSQNLVCNGGFESPAFTATSTRTTLPCWHSNTGQPIEVQTRAAGYATGTLGNQHLELDVDSNSGIYQDVPTVAGQRYRILFWVANRSGSPGSRVRIAWNGVEVSEAARSADQTGFVAIFSEVVATGPVSRLGFNAAGPSDGVGDLLDEVSLVPVPSAGSLLGYTYYIPHFADGDGWKSDILIANASIAFGTAVEYTVIGDDGAEVAANLKGSFTLDVRRSRVIESPGSPVLRTGWVKIRSAEPINASVIFRQSAAGRPDYEATVLAREPIKRAVAPFDNSGSFITGFAVMNPGASTLQITMRYYDDSGTLATDTVTLQPNAHTAFALTDRVTASRGKRGLIEMTGADASGNPMDFVPLGLRFIGGGAFTTLPY